MAGSNKKSATKGEIKDTKPLKKGKRKPKDDSETKVNLKKPKKDVIEKKKSDQKEMMKEFADCLGRIEAKVDLLEAKVDLLATKTDLHAILISAKGEKVPATKPPAKAASDSQDSYVDTSSDDQVTATMNPDAAAKKAKTESSSSEDDSSSADDEPANKPSSSSDGDNGESISVEGFDTSVPVDDIKSALSKHFSSFGEITRVYVPTDRETGASLGYAYIDLKEGAEKALELGAHDVGGWNLVVGKAEPIRSGSSWRFRGRCGSLGLCTYC